MPYYRPDYKNSGEKSTLMIPTYQALKGICESVYWKPSIIWYVDKLKVLNKIQTEAKGIRPIKYSGGNDLSKYLYLKDVAYIVTCHFEFNRNRPELKADQNENKHYFIAKRSLEKGGRRDIYLALESVKHMLSQQILQVEKVTIAKWAKWSLACSIIR